MIIEKYLSRKVTNKALEERMMKLDLMSKVVLPTTKKPGETETKKKAEEVKKPTGDPNDPANRLPGAPHPANPAAMRKPVTAILPKQSQQKAL
ncbi:hypothetical protein D3C87_1899550 [compost metagenome]